MLDSRQSRPVVASVFSSFDQFDLKPPKKVADAHRRYLSVLQALGDLPQSGSLAAAVLTAIEAGVEPAADPEVQRWVARQAVNGHHGIQDEIAAMLIEEIRTTCAEHADTLVALWRKPFDAAVVAIAKAHAALGSIQLDDTATVVRKGPDATAEWTSAVDACRTIEIVEQAWRSLQALLTGSYSDSRYRLLVIAAADPHDWDDQKHLELKPEPWTATLAGVPLSLPTFDEYRERVAAIAEARAGRLAGAEQAARDRFRTFPRPVSAA